jgi:hypothetical protein
VSLEAFLAELYVDPAARARFLADPRGAAAAAGLDARSCAALERIDRIGLELAAASFAAKRERSQRAVRTGRLTRFARRVFGLQS